MRAGNVRKHDVARVENIATDVLLSLRYPGLPRHVVEEEYIIRGNDPFFSPSDYGEEGVVPREKTEGGGSVGEGSEGGGRRWHIQGGWRWKRLVRRPRGRMRVVAA